MIGRLAGAAIACCAVLGPISLAAAQEAAPLGIEVPADLVLGRDAQAQITFDRPDGPLPELQVSAGEIGPVREASDGGLVAIYTLPEEQYPQVAILAVVSEGSALLDWIAIPLSAKARIDSKTEPEASVEIQIGERTFGPAVADRKGRTSIDVIVPPGIDQGVTIATDSVGNVKRSPLELDAPRFRRVLGLCPDAGDRLQLLVTDASGKPDEDARFELSASSGALAPPSSRAPGVYESTFTVPDRAQIGESVTLGARLTGDEAAGTECQVKIRGGRLARLELTVDPPTHVAGSGETVQVGVEFLDVEGRSAQPVPLNLSTELGQIGKLKAIADGGYAAVWTLPDAHQRKTRVEIDVESRSEQAVTASASVSLEPGPPTTIEIEADETSVLADGATTLAVTATVRDAFDNPVPEVRLTARAEGAIGPFADEDGDGTFEATYTAPKRGRATDDAIVVRQGGTDIEGSRAIRLLPARGVISLGPRVGFATNFGMISSFAVAADLDWRLPFFENLAVGVEAGFLWSDTEQSAAGGGEKVETSIRVIPLLARLTLRLPIDRFGLYLGGAGGMAISATETSSASTGRVEQSAVHPAVSGLGGADFALGPGRIVLEGEYLHTFTRAIDVEGNLGGLLVTAGYRFEL